MKNLDSILKSMLQVKSPAKLAGARASNRLSWQACESLAIIFNEFDNCDDFIAIFDYLEDFILYLKSNSSFEGNYYQMKTGSNQWTIDALIKEEKESGSILSKMFEIGDKFKAKELEFVSNKKLKARKTSDGKVVSNETLKFSDLHNDESIKITNHLSGKGINDLSQITSSRLSMLPIKVTDRDESLKGKMVSFVDSKYPKSKYSPLTLFLSLTNEVERRLKYEDELKDVDELKEEKCLNKEQFKSVIESSLNYETLEKLIDRIESQLQSEDKDFSTIRPIKSGIRRINNLRIARPHYFGLLLKSVSQLIQAVGTKEATLYDQAEDCFKTIKADKDIIEKIGVLCMNEDELFAMVIYEIFES
ncbi:dsDNA nuclease domain-containing protein [Halobacteriovorax sp. BALOs_7]|uniref:dsDNA nuclease domain-containing protein n=1 Tax=Halobacteriovorax sp. BALOs_7 TaxID=2109558 RepID=UPI0013C40381|nr:dsDNA nuclease domain-containing protein [Halobacteriovorax sp. BALOs_7]